MVEVTARLPAPSKLRVADGHAPATRSFLGDRLSPLPQGTMTFVLACSVSSWAGSFWMPQNSTV